jgi:hypothetical protein
MKKAIKFLPFIALLGMLTACSSDDVPNQAGRGYNAVIIGIGITAAAVLVFFIGLAIVSAFYKGTDVHVKILKKKEPKVLANKIAGARGGADLSRRVRRQKGRIRYSKITVELDGKKKVLKCSDVVIFDKLPVGKIQKIRIRFGEIVKILK